VMYIDRQTLARITVYSVLQRHMNYYRTPQTWFLMRAALEYYQHFLYFELI
jgi:hypothetical protein